MLPIDIECMPLMCDAAVGPMCAIVAPPELAAGIAELVLLV
ncbi:MAG: hypothetical protein ACLQMH_07620 [Solirubrobacteraceae bacterium]